MNERDKELAKQAWTENDWDAYVDVAKLIQLVRADERSNIRPQSSMAYQEGMEAATRAANESWTLMCKKMVEFERESIIDEWWSIVQADLENGVKCLNEQAATKWRKEYPSMATFGEWLEARGNT